MDLKDEQWAILEPLIPPPHRRPDGRGRPWRDAREVVNGILWVLRTGAPWQDVPKRYPSPATCHRRFQDWNRTGVFEKILRARAEDLRDRGKLDLTECFVDASFVGAKKGGFVWARRSAERVQSSWQLRTAMVFLSPSTWPVLRQLKSNWSTRPLTPVSSKKSQSDSSGTRPTTATHSRKRSPKSGSS
jgi:transposase